MFRTGVGGNSPGTPSGGEAEDKGLGPDLASAPERLDVRPPSPKNGRPEPRVLLVEHQSADAEPRWSRALGNSATAAFRSGPGFIRQSVSRVISRSTPPMGAWQSLHGAPPRDTPGCACC